MSRIANLARVAVVVSGAVASIATSKVESGERGDGECPPGEECSDNTPTGLYFGGTRTGDSYVLYGEWPRATVIGGRQTIRMYYDPDAEQPLDLPFDASLTTDALAIAAKGSNTVTVQGQAEGSSLLRITEPGTDRLYDRITLEARPADSVVLVPAGNYDLGDWDLYEGTRSFAVLAGSSVRVTAALYAADQTRLVDEDMRVLTGGDVSGDPRGYVDTVLVTPSAGNLGIVVTTAGVTHTVGLRVAAAADSIAIDSDAPIAQGSGRTICFRALVGADVLLGARLSYSVSGPIEVTRDDEERVASDCLRVQGIESGTATISVSGAGTAASFSIEVTDSSASQRLPEPRAQVSLLAGQRAHTAE